MSPFEKFMQKDQGHYCVMPTVTLAVGETKSHVARFNCAACRQFKLCEWGQVELYFDRERRAIAFGHASEGSLGSHRVIVGSHYEQATVSCKAFLRHIGITETIRLPIELDEETGFLVAVLPELPKREGE